VAKRKKQERPAPATSVPSGPAPDFDSPWKEALDRYFEPFLAFFFPEAHADIDWRRRYKMLDNELQQIVGAAEQGRRVVDKLAKVWLKSGEEKWILVRVEVQTGRERGFPRRMYVYNYRIFDRYDREVVSLAILADDDAAWRPSRFGYSRWGFRTRIEFPAVKLLDYVPRIDALEADPNPFATVVLAHLKALQTRGDPADRQVWKLRLAKGLYERGLVAEDVRQLFRFIDWIMALPEPLERAFLREVHDYQEARHMPFIDISERVGIEKGLRVGIEAILEIRFGEEGLKLMPEIQELWGHELLRQVLDAAKTAAKLEDVRRVWTRRRRSKKQPPT
jgi:hypothetical protein